LIELVEENSRNIQVVNAPKLNSFDLSKINSALDAAYDKLQKIVANKMLLVLHFKESRKEGRRENYGIHLRLSFPGRTLVASETGWDVVATVQKALHVLERETVESVKRRQEKV